MPITAGTFILKAGEPTTIFGSFQNRMMPNYLIKIENSGPATVKVTGQGTNRAADLKLMADDITEFNIPPNSTAVAVGFHVVLTSSRDAKGKFEVLEVAPPPY
jgi:hypothetical protein